MNSTQLSPAARECLKDLATALVEDWRVFAVDAVSQAEVRTAVDEVVERVLHAGDDGESTDLPVVPALLRRVATMLRRRLIESDDGLPPAEFRAMLRALEIVSAGMDPRWSDRFQDRMAGPSGLDLIVEVAHDLRSPLTSILFLAETMLRGRSGALTALQERQLGLVYSAAFGLNAVASDVIELVRGGDRLVGRQQQPFSVAEVLESVRDIVQPIAEEKGLEMHFEGPTPDHRMGYPGALNRVLLNLTTNALKFTAEGRVKVTLTEVEPGMLDCRVCDTGRGIPDAAMPTLYEPFRRRQQAGDYAFSGSGLGLSICRKLVEGMGATLAVNTVHGEGTCFSFRVSAPLVSGEVLFG